MTAYALLTRRMLLKDMGKAGLAVIVFGAAACTEEPTEEATPTEDAGETSASEPSTSTTQAASSTSSTSPEASEPSGASTGLVWHRVNLGFVSAYILFRDGEAAVVDTGVAGSEGSIEAALAEVGLGWDSVGHLIVTHKHPDHQGSTDAVLAATTAPWYAGAGDIEMITAPTAGSAVRDGDTIFDLEIIETPGHTPGHISVLDPVSRVLVAGDAINGADDGVVGPNPDFSENMDVANASVVKLASFDYEVVLFGHGEPVTEGASGLVAELARPLNGG